MFCSIILTLVKNHVKVIHSTETKRKKTDNGRKHEGCHESQVMLQQRSLSQWCQRSPWIEEAFVQSTTSWYQVRLLPKQLRQKTSHGVMHCHFLMTINSLWTWVKKLFFSSLACISFSLISSSGRYYLCGNATIKKNIVSRALRNRWMQAYVGQFGQFSQYSVKL